MEANKPAFSSKQLGSKLKPGFSIHPGFLNKLRPQLTKNWEPSNIQNPKNQISIPLKPSKNHLRHKKSKNKTSITSIQTKQLSIKTSQKPKNTPSPPPCSPRGSYRVPSAPPLRRTSALCGARWRDGSSSRASASGEVWGQFVAVGFQNDNCYYCSASVTIVITWGLLYYCTFST